MRNRIGKANQTPITEDEDQTPQNSQEAIENLSLTAEDLLLDIEGLSPEEKRKKVQELHSKMTAIEAFISKTKHQIKKINTNKR